MIPFLSAIRNRLHPPRSLRKQLLAISLLILSGLLLLIGVLQYAIMRNFLYTSRVEAMQLQIRSVPRELIFELAGNRQESSGAAESPYRGRERRRREWRLYRPGQRYSARRQRRTGQ